MAFRSAILGLISLLAGAARPLFDDSTSAAGLVFRHANSKTERKYLPETMSGGVAIFDFDQDGWMDVFFVNGAQLVAGQTDGVDPDKSEQRFWNRLYRNRSDGSFQDVTEKFAVRGKGYGMGVAAADYDNDGFPDLLVTNYANGDVSAVVLYHNDRGEKFTDVTSRAGLAGARGWATSAGFFDYDRDGDLDLFVCRYVKHTFALDDARGCRQRNAQAPGSPTRAGFARVGVEGRSYCHPDQFEPIPNYLFRNNGDGTFTDVSEPSGIAAHAGKGLGVAFADYNNDGWPDISVANDSVRQFLFRNEQNGRFTEVAMQAGVAYDEDGKDFGGMGTDFADLDGDGRPDILTTTISQQTYAYFRNSGDGTFDYRTRVANLGSVTHAYTGWGVRVFDFDNDGTRDVFFANGHVMDDIELSQPHIRYLQPPLLLRHTDRRFVNVSTAAGTPFSRALAGRGAATGDLDNDGDQDVVISSCGQAALYARNNASGNNWIGLRLRGTKSNRDGIGARLVLTTKSGRKQYATVSTAASYLSSQDPRVFFGLGKDEAAEVRITWPSGTAQVVVPKSRHITIAEETWSAGAMFSPSSGRSVASAAAGETPAPPGARAELARLKAAAWLPHSKMADPCVAGAEALDRRDFAAAEAALAQCVRIRPVLTTYLQLAAAYQAQGKAEELYKTVLEGIKRFPAEKRFYLTAGAHAGRNKQYTGAVEILEQAARRWPDDPQVRSLLSGAHVGAGMEALDAAQNQAAEKHLRRATQLAPNDVEAQLNLGRALHNLNRPAEAVDVFDRVVAANSTMSLAHFHRGMSLESIGEVDRAIADFTREIELNPDYPPTYLLRGTARLGKGAAATALEDLEIAVQRMPENPSAQFARARALVQLGRTADAETGLRKTIDLSPADPAPLNALVRLLMQSGRAAEAQPLAARAADLSRRQRTAAPGEIRTAR